MAKKAAKKATKRAKKVSRVRAMLNRIDAFLVRRDDDSEDLWSILTALRGPDNEGYNEKNDRTIPIRRAAFPKCRAEGLSAADFGISGQTYIGGPTNSVHFCDHAHKAARALKLIK